MTDYGFYASQGGPLSPDAFTRLAGKAWAYLEALTLGRVNSPLPAAVSEKVDRACCALVEEYAAQERGGEVVSAVNDGCSETYASSGRTPGQRLYAIAALYLAPTGLLYAGMGGGCCARLY